MFRGLTAPADGSPVAASRHQPAAPPSFASPPLDAVGPPPPERCAPPAAAADASPPASAPPPAVAKRDHPPAARRKTAKRAKFIVADPAAARINLGEDGRLPELKLAADRPRAKEEAPAKAQSPWLLIGVLLISTAASLGMLLTPQQAGTPDDSAAARRHLQQHYIGTEAPLEAYQLRLRQALQAHSRSETAQEQRLYRQVLDMLKREGKNEDTGLTGAPHDAGDPPNDIDLERWLNRLIDSGAGG